MGRRRTAHPVGRVTGGAPCPHRRVRLIRFEERRAGLWISLYSRARVGHPAVRGVCTAEPEASAGVRREQGHLAVGDALFRSGIPRNGPDPALWRTPRDARGSGPCFRPARAGMVELVGRKMDQTPTCGAHPGTPGGQVHVFGRRVLGWWSLLAEKWTRPRPVVHTPWDARGSGPCFRPARAGIPGREAVPDAVGVSSGPAEWPPGPGRPDRGQHAHGHDQPAEQARLEP